MRNLDCQHYTQLQPREPNDPLFAEWEVYRREVPQWVADGKLGWTVVIQDGQIVGLWERAGEALFEAARRYAGKPILVQYIREYYTPVRLSWLAA